MSGVEAVGVVLAVIPLLISALSNYREGLKKSKRVWSRKQYELKIRRLILRLKAQRTHFSINVTRLIRAAAPEADIKDLPEDYNHELWYGDLSKRVIEYLSFSGALEAFKETIELYEDYLKDIANKLQCILRDPEAEEDSLKGLLNANKHQGGKFRFNQRIQFVMAEDEVEQLIKNMNESNLSIRSFVDETEELHQLEARRTAINNSLTSAKTLHRVRMHADVLFRTICLKCRSDCHPDHDAVLFLDDRCSRPTRRIGPGEADTDFRILFAPRLRDQETRWHEATITVRRHDDHTSTKLRGKAKVGFVDSNPGWNTARRRVSFLEPRPVSTTSLSMQEVDDLCETITQAARDQSASSLSLLEGGSLFWHQPGVVPDTLEPPTLAVEEVVSLEKWLQLRSRLEPKHRLQLAVSISASLLQLNSTPWLRKCWTKQTIFFRQDPGGFRKIRTDSPLLLQSCGSANVSYSMEDDPEIALLELGILLLEIWNRRTLESWAIDTNNQFVDNDDGRTLLAIKWFKDVKDDLPPNFRDVVGRCVRPAVFDRFTTSWQDADFRNAVFENIVDPLLAACASMKI